ncbi:MAG: hypothetical protein ACOY32_15855 [Thermodesulfobacteriota bacterium]
MNLITEKLPQGHPVTAMPGNAAFGLEPFQVAGKEHSEVNTRRNRGTSGFRKKRGTFLFQPDIKPIVIEKTVESRVKGMATTWGQVAMSDPERKLFVFSAFTDGHGEKPLLCDNVVAACYPFCHFIQALSMAKKEFFSGLLG